MKRRNPAFIILIFLFWYYSTIRERKKPLLQDIFHKVRVTNLTQGGLKAMESLAELEEERRSADSAGHHKISHDGVRSVPKGTASNEMCTFLIMNISSLQLVPVSIIAYRSQYGSANPTAVVGPAIAATAVSTLAAVAFCKVMSKKRRA